MGFDEMADPCTLLDWDSRFWGFPIARLNSSTLSAALLDQVAAWCATHRIRCLYFRADGSCPRTLAMAADAGFRFVDVRMELSLALTGLPLVDSKPGEDAVRPATGDDLAELQQLAAHAHRDTRFYKDDRFDAAKAADLYRTWIERDFAAHLVLICESPRYPERPCGYVTCEYDATKGEGRIGLIAVASQAAGRGFGTQLMHAALRYFVARGLQTVRVVTQATNVPAMRLYEAAGFRTSNVTLWFHKWFPKGN